MKSVFGSSPWQTVRTLGGTGVAVGGTGEGVLVGTTVGNADGNGVGDGGSWVGFGFTGVGWLQAATRLVSNNAATVRRPGPSSGSIRERRCR
jgi:hypothetical protein